MSAESIGIKIGRPVVKKRHGNRFWVWLLPLLAAGGAFFYFRAFLIQNGPEIAIELNDAEGIRVGQTPVLHRGVTIGQVSGIKLSENKRRVWVTARLRRDQDSFARQGAEFWVVRPEISAAGFQGMGTLLSGPYIDSSPGRGEAKMEFHGLASPPESGGLHLVLHTSRLGHLAPDSPIYYRGIEVGSVREIRLGGNAQRVDIYVVVSWRYSPLVRTHTRFWNKSGLDIKAGLFKGVEIKLDSLRSLLSGSIAFATPEKDPGEAAKEGTEFALEDAAQKDWLKWAPSISINPANANTDEKNVDEKMKPRISE